MLPYKLRPHHGLCISFFEGKGYSEEFVTHMWEIISSCKEGATITIVNGTDDICSKCPNGKESGCNSYEKVAWLDQQVAEACGYESGKEYSFTQFLDQVQEELIRTNRWETICRGCQWYPLCQEIKQRIFI